MIKHIQKRTITIILVLIALIFGSALIVPLFIKVQPLEGGEENEAFKTDDSLFITIPFEGTDGIDIHYLESGSLIKDEPVFILLHGSMYNSFSWNRVIDYFGSKGRAIAYDQIPYGLSEKITVKNWTGQNPYTQDAAIDQLLSLLDGMGLTEIYLVGQSYGGTLAARAAIEHPERVKGLILVDAAVFVNESMPKWSMNTPQIKNLGPLFARSMGSGSRFYEQCYTDPIFFSGERKELTTIMTKVENWDMALWQYLSAWGASTEDFTEQLNEIKIPTLVLSGSEDQIIPVSDSEKLNEILLNSNLIIIPDSGHMPQEEKPEAFIRAVDSWIDKIIGVQ